MNFLIVGNIASGKTTLSKTLGEKTTCVKTCSIDEYRTKYSDGTFAGEFHAWAMFLREIQNAPNVNNSIFEFSGTGKNAWFVRQAMDYNKEKFGTNWRVIFCSCNPAVISDRAADKVYDIPMPYNFDNIQSSIKFIGQQLSERANSNYFNAPEIIVRTDNQTPEECIDEVLQSYSA